MPAPREGRTKRGTWQRTSVVVTAGIIVTCGCSAPAPSPAGNLIDVIANETNLSTIDVPTPPPAAAGEDVPVSSDPRASYRLLEWRRMPNGHREALTRRVGPSGTSFARREINCDAMQFRYLGEGDTLEDARRDSPNIGHMAELIPGSISTEVSEFVCRK